MRNYLLLLAALFCTLTACGQNNSFHFIKFLHVGEQMMAVHTLNITTGEGAAPQDSIEQLNDTVKAISVTTDEKSYNAVSNYLKNADYRIVRTAGRLDFATFKIVNDGSRFYLPDISVTDYFKKMVKYLKKKNADPAMVKAIVDNYPWIFNP
jgi:hypothetical protein